MRLIFSGLTYKNVGGAENLIFEVVRCATKSHGVVCVLSGSYDSFVIQRLKKEGVYFEYLESECWSELDESDSDVFLYFHNHEELKKLKNKKGIAVFWGILSRHITTWNKFGFEFKITGRRTIGDYLTRKLILFLRKKDGMFVMDGATSDSIEKFVGQKLRLPLLPVPVDTKNLKPISSKKLRSNEKIVVSYIGRSDDLWKIKPIKKVCEDLNKIEGFNFDVNIYTDCEIPYLKEINTSSYKNLSLNFYTAMYGEKLRAHIAENSYLHFSMGTAALEGGLSGVPTILVDACSRDFPDGYRYRWLFETDRFSLGRFLSEDDVLFQGQMLHSLITKMFSDEFYMEIAEKCQSYVCNNHSVEVVVPMLLGQTSQVKNSNITWFTPSTWLLAELYFVFKKILNFLRTLSNRR